VKQGYSGSILERNKGNEKRRNVSYLCKSISKDGGMVVLFAFLKVCINIGKCLFVASYAQVYM
jgi:hypothetical protein